MRLKSAIDVQYTKAIIMYEIPFSPPQANNTSVNDLNTSETKITVYS